MRLKSLFICFLLSLLSSVLFAQENGIVAEDSDIVAEDVALVDEGVALDETSILDNPYATIENDLADVEGQVEVMLEDGSLEKGSDDSETIVSLLNEIQGLLGQVNSELLEEKMVVSQSNGEESQTESSDINTATDNSDEIIYANAGDTTDEKSTNTDSTGSQTDTAQNNTATMPAYYVVKKRNPLTDCLWRIAGYSFIYNNASSWKMIYEANKDIIKNADYIYPGQVLAIPAITNERRSGTYDEDVI